MKLSLLMLDNSSLEGCSVLCRIFTNILDLCPLDGSSKTPNPLLQSWQPKSLQTLKMYPGENIPPIKNYCSKPIHSCLLLGLQPHHLTSVPGCQLLHLTFHSLHTRVLFKKTATPLFKTLQCPLLLKTPHIQRLSSIPHL